MRACAPHVRRIRIMCGRRVLVRLTSYGPYEGRLMGFPHVGKGVRHPIHHPQVQEGPSWGVRERLCDYISITHMHKRAQAGRILEDPAGGIKGRQARFPRAGNGSPLRTAGRTRGHVAGSIICLYGPGRPGRTSRAHIEDRARWTGLARRPIERAGRCGRWDGYRCPVRAGRGPSD